LGPVHLEYAYQSVSGLAARSLEVPDRDALAAPQAEEARIAGQYQLGAMPVDEQIVCALQGQQSGSLTDAASRSTFPTVSASLPARTV
jgi:hypothetical protein